MTDDAQPDDLVPFYLKLPRAEAARLRNYANAYGRPMTWVIRDALRLYLDALEVHVVRPADVPVDLGAVGRIKSPRRGRPPRQPRPTTTE